MLAIEVIGNGSLVRWRGECATECESADPEYSGCPAGNFEELPSLQTTPSMYFRDPTLGRIVLIRNESGRSLFQLAANFQMALAGPVGISYT